MADKNFIKVRIGTEADTRGVEAMEKRIVELEAQVQRLGKSSASLKQGFLQGIGQDVYGDLKTTLAAIPTMLRQAVVEGLNFNATVESARLGVAAIFKQFDTTGSKSFQDAMRESGEAIDLLKEKAKTSPATFEQLVGGFQGLAGSMSAAGLGIKQQVDLVVLMSQALSGLGIRSDQLLQESRALVTGNITEDAAAARILGITKAQVDSARESGQLFDFLTSKLDAFAEAGAVGAESYNTQISNLEDNLTQLKGVATEEFFTQIKDGLKGINAELGAEKAEQMAAGLGAMLGNVLPLIGDVGEKLKEGFGGKDGFWDMSGLLATWKPLVNPAMSATRAEQLDKEKLSLRKGISGEDGAEKIEAAISRRRAEAAQAEGEVKTQLEGHVAILERMLARRADIVATVKEETATQPKAVEQTEKQARAAEKLADQVERLMKEIGAEGMTALTAPEQLTRQTEQLAKARESFARRWATAPDFDAQQTAQSIAANPNIPGEAKTELLQDLREILKLTAEVTKGTAEQTKSYQEQLEKAEQLTATMEESWPSSANAPAATSAPSLTSSSSATWPSRSATSTPATCSLPKRNARSCSHSKRPS
jgi:hypothetical protein